MFDVSRTVRAGSGQNHGLDGVSGTSSALEEVMNARIIAALGIAACAAAWAATRGAHTAVASPVESASRPLTSGEDSLLWMEMRNVDLRIDARSAMRVRSLRGQVVPVTPGRIAWLDDPKSFVIRATSGTVALDGDAVTTLLNEIAFNYPGAPIKGLRVRIEEGKVVQSGTLHKGVDIPFEMWAVPVLQNDGRIRLHPDKLRIFGVNGLALMKALGLTLEKMMDLSKARGASVSGDDIFLDPLKIIPPPLVEGRLRAVRIEGNLLVQEFARTAEDSLFGTFVRPDSGSRNFIYFRGGSLRFGKLTMTDTDLLIHDADEQDPFDLYFVQYNRQLVAGHTKNLMNFGLRTWMVDFAKLGDGTRTIATRPPR
jgi:hypothetical protein